MGIIYRKATLNDLHALVRMRVLFLKEVQEVEDAEREKETGKDIEEYFSKSLSDDSFVAWIAEEDGEIIATSGLSFYQIAPSFHLKGGKIAYILNIFVLQEHRGRKLGKKIFELILNEAKERGYKRILLHASDDGRPVYEKFGFKGTTDEMILNL